MTFESVKNILPTSGYQIALVKTTGKHILEALEQAAIVPYEEDPGSYTHMALQFVSRLTTSLLEGDWGDSIIPSLKYLVASTTNKIMADKIDATNQVVLSYTDIELFMEYSKTVCILEDPPLLEYLTQYFDGLNDLILTQAAYSCLQDDSLCKCGFC